MPQILHEIFGLIMTATVFAHIFINRKNFFYLLCGKISARKVFSTMIICSSIVIILAILTSGILISSYIFHDFIPLEIRRNISLYHLHKSLPYVFMILIGCHIGLHWRSLVKIKNSVLEKIFMLTLSFAGIIGLVLNCVGDRIIMKHIFSTPATEMNWGAFLFIIFSTTGLYAVITFCLDMIIKKR